MTCPVRLSAGVPTCRDCGVVVTPGRTACPREAEPYGTSAPFDLGSARPLSSPGAVAAGGVSSPPSGPAGPRPLAAQPSFPAVSAGPRDVAAPSFVADALSGHSPRAPP